MKSATVRLAPPTNAPSTSCTAKILAAFDQPLADGGVHFTDLGAARNLARADRPDRLVGDGELGLTATGLRDRGVELSNDGVHRRAALAHLESLADAQDHAEPARQRSLGLGHHVR